MNSDARGGDDQCTLRAGQMRHTSVKSEASIELKVVERRRPSTSPQPMERPGVDLIDKGHDRAGAPAQRRSV
ncbi:hypothetical protein DEF98_006035 [Xanthomonas vasicola]|nr:hypothetical protein KWO_018110 [Xanthomonas vasicola pv. musacearum NCPPB 4379]RJL84584.1 hypothetical protein DEG03_007690 [Xanthomonas vasicola]RRJ42443.1 hypothetical protein EIM46_05565 [Xanthomonas vasicola pv. musacearum]RJL88602.1 hypothetical protein DEF98_006035 [Xanthomonas vasicola]RJL91472.1 hypothetical protein DEF95_005290 [Xanthomonas vasicola]